MATCAILQSSYLPWVGYFDIIRRADTFVFLDQVQYTRRDWRNRNQIKSANGVRWLTVPVKAKHHRTLRISDVYISQTSDWADCHWKTIEQSYARAPFRNLVLDRLRGIYSLPPERLVELNRNLIQVCWNLISENAEKRFLGDEQFGGLLRGDRNERLLEICKAVGADRYLSGPAAKSYLDTDRWRKNNIDIEYIDYAYSPYPQLHGGYVEKLSVIDALMNLGPGFWNLLLSR